MIVFLGVENCLHGRHENTAVFLLKDLLRVDTSILLGEPVKLSGIDHIL